VGGPLLPDAAAKSSTIIRRLFFLICVTIGGEAGVLSPFLLYASVLTEPVQYRLCGNVPAMPCSVTELFFPSHSRTVTVHDQVL